MPSLPRRRQRGAALLLMVVLLGLGVSMLLISTFGPSTDAVRARRTTQALNQARDALVGYAMLHGRLPRPARADTSGQESGIACTSTASCSGLIPSATLGIEPLDGWGKILRYSVTPAFTTAPLDRNTLVADKQVLTRNAQGAASHLTGQEMCTVGDPCTPAVVLSSGKYNLGISASGREQANTSSGNTDEIQNNRALNVFYSHRLQTDPAAPGGEFDDLLTWVPLTVLYRQMAIAGKLP